MRIELELKLGKGILPFLLGSQLRDVLNQIQDNRSCSMKNVMIKYVYSGSKDAYAGGKVRPHDILVDIISCGILLRFSGVSQMLTSIEVYNLKFVNILYKGILFSLKLSPSSEDDPLISSQLAPISLDSGSNSLSDVVENSVLSVPVNSGSASGPAVAAAGSSATETVEPTFYHVYNVFGMTQKGEYSEDYSTYMLKYGQLDFTFEIPPRFREDLKGSARLPKELIDDPSLVAVKIRHYVSDPSDSYFAKLTWDIIDAYSAFLKERSREISLQAQKMEEKIEAEQQDAAEPQPVIEQPIPQVQEERGKQRKKRGGAKGKGGVEKPVEEKGEDANRKMDLMPQKALQKEGAPKPVDLGGDDDDDEEFTRFAGGSGLAFSYSPEPLFCGEICVLRYWDPVLVKAGYGLILPGLRENALLPFGSNAQDVVMRLGSPESIFYPGRDARLTDITGDKDQRNVFFYNYFSLGIDVMFDTNSASVVKFVLHCNVPHHKDFNTYAKCNFFVIPERLDGTATAAYKEAKSAQQRSEMSLMSLINAFENGAISDHKEDLLNADTVWEEYTEKLGDSGDPFINEVSKQKNPFSETFFHVLDGLVVEVLPNGTIASLCVYPLP